MKENPKYLSPELILDEFRKTVIICTSSDVDGLPTIQGNDVTNVSEQFYI